MGVGIFPVAKGQQLERAVLLPWHHVRRSVVRRAGQPKTHRAWPRRVPERWASTRRRTSEHWWEDEEEFDAVTDASTPKMLVLVTPPSPCAAAADAQLHAARHF